MDGRTDGRTDRWTDLQTDKVIPVYPPINFVEAGGIINMTTPKQNKPMCTFYGIYSPHLFVHLPLYYCGWWTSWVTQWIISRLLRSHSAHWPLKDDNTVWQLTGYEKSIWQASPYDKVYTPIIVSLIMFPCHLVPNNFPKSFRIYHSMALGQSHFQW